METVAVPFLWYRKADCEGEYDGGASEDTMTYHYQRAQLLVKFTPESGSTRVLVARIIFDTFKDFCGGAIVRSPQIITSSRTNWGRTEFFFNPGVGGDQRIQTPLLTWVDLERGNFPCPDLGRILGQQYVSEEEARDWALSQLALTIPTFAMSNARRLIHASGNVGGIMYDVIDRLNSLYRQQVPAMARMPTVYGTIGGATHGARYSGQTLPGARALWEQELNPTDEYCNYNSGRKCVSWNMVFTFVDSEWSCDACGAYNEDTTMCYDCGEDISDSQLANVAPEVRRAILEEFYTPYTSTEYTRALTRPIWRNG